MTTISTIENSGGESFADLFAQSLVDLDMQTGSIVTGTVIDIDNEWVTVHAGLKSEGVIAKSEFLSDAGEFTLQVGDKVKVSLEAVEDGYGETKLSREKAKRAETWLVLEEAFEKGSPVIGIINGKVKGGFTVDVNTIRAFLPGSLVDIRPIRDTTHLEGKELEFKLIKLDQKRNNVVVSRRAVLESVNTGERDALLNSLQEGMSVKGVVKNLTDYGAFVDLGGIDGLLHITDMSWKRIKHPSEIVAVGAEVEVKVLKFDRERNRVSLGLKQLGEDPWVEIKRRYPENTKVKAVITNLTDYGCFAELEEGVEGLVHVSEMDWTNKNIHPSKIVQLGDEVEVMILDIDQERRRISLGIKQPLLPNSRKATASLATSSRSLISVSLLDLKVRSTVWFIFPISHGTSQASRQYASSPRAINWRQSFCRLIPSVNASRWVSSNCRVIRSSTSSARTRKVPSSKAL